MSLRDLSGTTLKMRKKRDFRKNRRGRQENNAPNYMTDKYINIALYINNKAEYSKPVISRIIYVLTSGVL